MGSGRGFVGWLVLGFGAAACERHVELRFPDTSPGEEYVCSVTGGAVEKCVPQTTIDPRNDNREGTVLVILPRECKGHFNQITIHDSGSSSPSVNVKCAPLENTIQ